MIFKLSGYTLDIDVEKTREYNEGLWSCDCQACRNYEKALQEIVPSEVFDFFGSIGLDPRGPERLGWIPAVIHKGEINYDGHYYLAGRILEGGKPAVVIPREIALEDVGKYLASLDKDRFPSVYSIGDWDFTFSEGAIKKEIDGHPVFVMDFNATLPFVLDEENEIS